MSNKLEQRLKAFTYHKPSHNVQGLMNSERIAYMDLARHIDLTVPECDEKSLAFTALEESAMWTMKALSLTDPEGEVIQP